MVGRDLRLMTRLTAIGFSNGRASGCTPRYIADAQGGSIRGFAVVFANADVKHPDTFDPIGTGACVQCVHAVHVPWNRIGPDGFRRAAATPAGSPRPKTLFPTRPHGRRTPLLWHRGPAAIMITRIPMPPASTCRRSSHRPAIRNKYADMNGFHTIPALLQSEFDPADYYRKLRLYSNCSGLSSKPT